MADTQIMSSNDVIKFSKSVMTEYFNKSGFVKYTGTTSNSIIQIKNESMGQPGSQINFPVVRQLKGAGVSGSEQLWGNEEALKNSTDTITLSYLRNGVRITNDQGFRSQFDVLSTARPLLTNWAANNLRELILTQLAGVLVPTAYGLNGSTDTVDAVIAYASATDTQKNTHFTNNSDRVYAGGVGTVTSEADIATKATAITSIDDILAITAAVRSTLTDDFPITPIASNNDTGSRTYVWFVGNKVFSKIKAAIAPQISYADVRGPDNDLFQNGDLYFDGVVIRLIPELDSAALSITPEGGSATTIETSYICGAQAVLLSYGKTDTIKTQDFDYEFQKGVSIQMLRGMKKASYLGKQTGVFSVFSQG